MPVVRLGMMGVLLAAVACSDGPGTGEDADAGGDADRADDVAEAADETGDGSDAETTEDVDAGGPVLVGCWGLELACNTDATDGRARLRWHFQFSVPAGSGPVANIRVTSLSLIDDPDVRTAVDPVFAGGVASIDAPGHTTDELYAWIEATPDELAECTTRGPSLRYATHDLVVRAAGTSDRGSWEGECVQLAAGTLWTCHTGLSAVALRAWADNSSTGQAGADVELRTPTAITADGVTLDSFLLRDAAGDEFELLPATGAPDTWHDPPREVWIRYSGDLLPLSLCPDVGAGGRPQEVYVLYEGTAAGLPFSGAAPAGQCSTDP